MANQLVLQGLKMTNQLKFILLLVFVILLCLYTLWFYSTWHGLPESAPSDQKKATSRVDHAEVEALMRLNKTA